MAFDTRIFRDTSTGLVVDLSAAPSASVDLGPALEGMAALEAGAKANPDEDRQVGHYWLRAPERAPDGGEVRYRHYWALSLGALLRE